MRKAAAISRHVCGTPVARRCHSLSHAETKTERSHLGPALPQKTIFKLAVIWWGETERYLSPSTCPLCL